MLVCESEENRRKLAWLVPGYILLAWFFCVVFQPLGLTTVPGRGNNNDFNDESLYEILNLQDDPQVGVDPPPTTLFVVPARKDTYTVKKVVIFPVPSWNVTNPALSGYE